MGSYTTEEKGTICCLPVLQGQKEHDEPLYLRIIALTGRIVSYLGLILCNVTRQWYLLRL